MYVVQLLMPGHIGASVLVAVPAAFVVAGIAGAVLERTIIRFLYGRPLETLLATFGVSLVLQQLVRSIFSANNRAVETPALDERHAGDPTMRSRSTYNRLYIVAFTVLVFAALLVVLRRTRLGLDIRAVAQNRAMAQAMGIPSGWIDAMTFGLGSGIAGIAGVALSQFTNVGPNLGQSYIIDSFMVVVFGGFDRQPVGHVHRRHVDGVVDKLLDAIMPGAVLSKIAVLVAPSSAVHPAAGRADNLPADRAAPPRDSTTRHVLNRMFPLTPPRGTDSIYERQVLTLTVSVVLPVLALGVPAGSPFHLSAYALTLVGKYMCYAMLAMAVDLVWGYCGILSLGHAAFFALGGYAIGMYLMRQIGARGVWQEPAPPRLHGLSELDRKTFLVLQYGFNHWWFALSMVVVVPGRAAPWCFGWLAFRSRRVTGVYLSIITQALSYALMLAFFRNDMGFGGNNGFTDFKDILGIRPPRAIEPRVVLVVITAVALAASYLACTYIVDSRAGRVVRAIRDGESRTRFLGYAVENYKLWLFVFSAGDRRNRRRPLRAADRHHQPQRVRAHINSIEVVIWVAVGGREYRSTARHHRRRDGQLRQDLLHRSLSRGVALRARGAVCAGHAVPAARHHRTLNWPSSVSLTR